MVAFLKTVYKGLLNILFLPFGLICIALYAIFGVFVFIYRFGKLIYLFFSGRNLTNELAEDIEAKKIIEANKPKEESIEEPALSLYPSDSDMYKEGYVSPTFEDKKEEDSPLEEGEEEHE